MPRTPFHCFLDEDLMAGLKRLQERTGASIGESIRRATRAYLIAQGELPAAKKPQRRKQTR